MLSDNGQELATSLSLNSKGEANSTPIKGAMATSAGHSGNAQDSKSQPSSYEVLDDNVTSSDSAKNKGSGKGSGSGPKQEEEKKAPSSEDSWQEAELTDSII